MANISSAGSSQRFQSFADAANRAIGLAPVVGQALSEKLSVVLADGETVPNLDFVHVLVARCLALHNRNLEISDTQRKHLKSIEVHRRVVIEAASAKLRDALIDVRYSMDRTLTRKEAMALFEGRSNLSRLKSPVLERVSDRLVRLLEEPSLGWANVGDEGHRNTVETNKLRLQSALAEFHQAQQGTAANRDAFLNVKDSYERDYRQKSLLLRSVIRLIRGIYQGIDFDSEAAALVLRRRNTSSGEEEEPEEEPEPAPAPPQPGKAAPAAAG